MPKKKNIPEPEPTFDVEVIYKARVTEGEVWEYFIKWGGYSEDDNSWEPESNLTGCRRMLKSFWEQAGPRFKSRARSLPIGHEVLPSALWIERERKAYHKTAEKKRARQEKRDNIDEETGEEDLETQDIASVPAEETYSDPDDIPLSMKIGRRMDNQSTGNMPASSTSSEDAPASKRKWFKTNEIDQPSPGPSTKRIKGHVKRGAQGFPAATPPSNDMKTRMPGSSPAGSLFTTDSDSDDTPLASQSTNIAFTPSLKAKQTESSSTKPSAHPSRSLSTTGPNPKSIPAHLQRKLNPRVKPMALPTPQQGDPQGISTKARISALGAISGQKSIDIASNPTSPLVGGQSLAAIDTSIAMDTLHPPASAELDSARWLRENIVVNDEVLTRKGSVGLLPATPSASHVQQTLHFSKRWRWTGRLMIGDNESENGFAELIGGVLLTDSTALDHSTSQFGIELLIPANVDSFSFRHLYSLATLSTALADFRISQFARMTAYHSEGENPFNDLVAYMTKHELYSQCPLSIAGRIVATMFVFPASFEHLWDRLSVPPKLRQGPGLLVAVGFQTYIPHRRLLGGSMETYCSDWKTSAKLKTLSENGAHSYNCSRALLALRFPDNVLRHIAQKECALFTTPADKELPGPDTLALNTVLRNTTGCKIVPVLTGSAMVIFIHVGAWDILHKLVGLVDRRLRRQNVQFYTYGSDPTVDERHWGVHEVFPIGGIVTFTPRAIAEDPEGVERLIGKLDEHPLWACYVLPSAVAMIVDVVSSDSGTKLKSAIDALCGILIPLEKGQIALTWQPPSCRSWSQVHDTNVHESQRIAWMIDQARLSELEGDELILECQKRLRRSQNRTERDVELSIIKDMLVMQSELRKEYRRFVIITDSTGASNTSREAAASTSASKADIKDGFEFTHVNNFTFGDGYTFVNS